MLAAGGLLALLFAGFAASNFLEPFTREDEDEEPDEHHPDPSEAVENDAPTALNDLLADTGFGTPGDAGPPEDDGEEEEDVVYDRSARSGTNQMGVEDDLVDALASSQDASDPDPAPFLVDIGETAILEGGETVAHVTDFDVTTDRLILDFEGSIDSAPDIGIDTTSEPGDAVVQANGTPVALVAGADLMTPDHVEVVMVPSALETPDIEDVDTNEAIPAAPDETDPLAGLIGDPEAVNSLLDALSDRLMDGGTTDDEMRARSGMDDLFGSGGEDALTGHMSQDVMTGTQETDAMWGNEGDDTLSGGGGNDELHGDDGDDNLSGGDGEDYLSGGEGADTLTGDAGRDMMFGGVGDDSLTGGEGDDFLQGGRGADTLDGGAGNDRIDGTFGAGRNLASDQDEGDLIDGGVGDDTILIGSGDTVFGGSGSDALIAGPQGVNGPGIVSDFDPAEDRIEVMYDPVQTPDPVITVNDFADGSGADILLNGEVVLRVSGAQGLDAAEIDLRAAAFR